MHLDWSIWIAYGFGFLILYFFMKLVLIPVRLTFKIFFNAGLGGLLIALLDLGGSFLGFYLPINPLSAIIVGFLGVPGLILLIILHYLLIT